MKTIQILPTKTKADYLSLVEDYSSREWGRAIELKNPRTDMELIDYVTILLMNFWQSMTQQNHKFLFAGMQSPEVYLKKPPDGNTVVMGWKIGVYEKKKQKSKKPDVPGR